MNTEFTEVVIGENVTEIGAYAFFKSTSLKNVYVKSTTPPSIGKWAFCYEKSAYHYQYPPIPNLKIYVPMNSVEDYKTQWSLYADNIVGYEYE